MERSHRIKIRERRALEDESVPIQPGPAVASIPADPFLVLTFRFGRRVIVAKPAWYEKRDGVLAHVVFGCPHCWDVIAVTGGGPGQILIDRVSGAITIPGCTGCVRCGLHLHVVAGVATAIPANLYCSRGTYFAPGIWSQV